MQQVVLSSVLNLFLAGGIFYFLWSGNLSKSKRHIQYYNLPILILVWLFTALIAYQSNLFNSSVGTSGSFLNIFKFTNPLLALLFKILLVHAAIKRIVKVALIKFSTIQQRLQRGSFAYKLHNNIYLLKRLYYYPYQFSMFTSIALLIIVSILLVLQPIPFTHSGYHLPFALVIPVSLTLELFWYLNGEKEGIPMLLEEDGKPEYYRNIQHYKIWKEYQEVWSSNFLVSWAFSAENTQNSEEKYEVAFEQLAQKNDLILVDSVYQKIGSSIFQHLKSLIAQKKKVIIIIPRDYRQSGSSNSYQNEIKNWIVDELPFLNGKIRVLNPEVPSINDVEVVISSANDLVHEIFNGREAFELWLKALDFVLVFKAQEVFPENLLRLQSLFYYLKTIAQDMQVAFLTDQLSGIQSAIQVNFPISRKYVEIEGFENLTKNVFFTVWKEENQDYQKTIQRSEGPNLIGNIPSLAALALKNGLKDFKFIGSKKMPLQEAIEEYDNEIDCLKPEYRKLESGQFTPHLSKLNLIRFENELIKETDNNAFFVYDEDFNFVTLFIKWRLYAISNVLINITSPPYLLREFFADHIEYFENRPISPIAPVISNSRTSLAHELLIRLTMGFVEEDDLKTYLQVISPIEADVKITLLRLLEAALGIKLKAHLVETKNLQIFQLKNGSFLNERSFKINRAYFDSFVYFKKIAFVDNSNEKYFEIDADFIYQRYLIGQKHVIYNRCYSIETIDINNGKCVVKNEENLSTVGYRNSYHIDIDLTNCRQQKVFDTEDLVINFLEPKISVSTLGFYEFPRQVNLIDRKEYSYHRSTNIPKREYLNGRVLEIDFFQGTLGRKYSDDHKLKILHTLQAIFHELIPTLFPKTFYYLQIFSGTNFDDKTLGRYFPKVQYSKPFSPFSLFLFEDCNQDIGVLGALKEKDNFELLIDLCLVYLEWCNRADSRPGAFEILGADHDFKKSGELKFPFLKYGGDNYPIDFDLSLTLEFLVERFGSKRKIILRSQNYYKKYNQDNKCDFCGNRIDQTNFTIFPDGRERCKNCDSIGIDSEIQLDHIYQKVKSEYVVGFRKLQLPSEINLKLVDAKFIHELVGTEFKPTSEHDQRHIGLATFDGKNYNIYIEDGYSPEEVELTVVHELTHIFQYFSVDYNKMKKMGGDLIIEGHARWAEIDYLLFRKDNERAKGLIKSSIEDDSKYGSGYRHIVKTYAKNDHKSLVNIHEKMLKHFPK